MLILKKTMLVILVVFTLGYSTAWAFDDHVVEGIFNATDASELSIEGLDHAATDHCGHVSAHLIGLISDVSFLLHEAPVRVYSEPSGRFISFVPLVNLRPPSV